jgi:hypothetical protein
MDISHLIQSSLAPVFLLSGVATTLGVLTNRLSRIIDRARRLEEQVESHPGRAPQLRGTLTSLARRAQYINVAISLATVAALMVALVVVALFANAFFLPAQLGIGIALLFVGSMTCLSAAFIAFFIEVRIAVKALRFEIPRASGPAAPHGP